MNIIKAPNLDQFCQKKIKYIKSCIFWESLPQSKIKKVDILLGHSMFKIKVNIKLYNSFSLT